MMAVTRWCWIPVLLLVGCAGAEPHEPPLVADPPLGEGPPGPTVGEARTALARGIALVKAEKFADARVQLEQSMAQAPSADAAFYLGVVKEKAGDKPGAEASYKKALELDPGAPEPSVNLAAIYLDDPPRPGDAIVVLKAALTKSPGNAQLLANLGYALGLQHDVDGASKAYDAALAKKDDPDLRFAYGTMLFENKKPEAAGEQLKKALPGAKDDPAVLATLGRMLGGTHAFAECVRAFDRAIKLKGDAAEFWVRRGTCRHELNDEPGAQADFEKAIALEPTFAAAHYYLGLSLVNQKKSLPGARELREAEKLGKGTPIEKLAHEKLQSAFKPPK